ncbi:MAG: tetratricopeptide repeat protein [Acidobacteriota bacterium]
MKRSLKLWLSLPAAAGLLAFALSPALAQQPPAAQTMGKIHGQVINPTGQPQGGGTVSLSTDGGQTSKLEMSVAADGTYSGEVPAGTYVMIYRAANTPKGQMVDEIKNIKIVAGQDTLQNDDMSRQEFIDKMTPDEKKQLEELKKNNAAALKENEVINHLNADLKQVTQDKKDIDASLQTAQQQLGASATKAAVADKAEEIKTAKYTDVETMMTKDVTVKPDEAILWTDLAFAQAGLKKYDDAITNYKKALDLETASKKPRPEILGAAQAGLGEVYARTGKAQDAQTAYDAAAKADPQRGPLYLKNETIIFFQQGNADAQATAADEAIKADPNDALLYYLKGQALVQKATIDPKTQRIVLPADCTAAYQKYLDLAPTGPFATEVAGILQQAGEKVSSSYKAGRKH